MTEIREPNYGIDLPGEWEKGHTLEEGAIVYCDTAGRDTLTVLLLSVKGMFRFSDPMRILTDYLHHRSTFEAGSSGRVVSTEEETRQADDAVEGAWSATDLESGRRFRHRVILKGGLLGDFRYVSLDLDEDAFDERARQILPTATITPPES